MECDRPRAASCRTDAAVGKPPCLRLGFGAPSVDKSTTAAAASTVGKGPRLFEHVEGQWPTAIWIDASAAEPVIRELCRASGRLSDGWIAHWDDPSATAPLHVSLSHPFAVREHQIAPLVDSLRRHLLDAATASVPLRCTAAVVDAPLTFVNRAQSREFLSLPLRFPDHRVPQALCRCIDEGVAAFGGDRFFDQPILHVSVAWRPLPVPDSAAGPEPQLPTTTHPKRPRPTSTADGSVVAKRGPSSLVAAYDSSEDEADDDDDDPPHHKDGEQDDDDEVSEQPVGPIVCSLAVFEVIVRCGNRVTRVPL